MTIPSKNNQGMGNVNYVFQNGVHFYQRSHDDFFNLSDACRQLRQKPVGFLGLVSTLIIFLNTQPTKPFGRLTISELLTFFPSLIKCDRRKNHSDLWLDQRFIPQFCHWAKKIKEEHWYYFLDNAQRMSYLHSIPLSCYEFYLKKPLKTRTILIREADGFVYSQAFFYSGLPGKISTLLNDGSFVSALHLVFYERENRIADLSYLNSSETKNIYDIFSDYLDVILGKSKAFLWVDPQVASAYADDDIDLLRAIADWKQRQQPSQRLKITLLSVAKQSDKPTKHPLLSFRSTGYDLSIYEDGQFIGLKITDVSRQWYFLLDLVSGQIYLDRGLLSSWGCFEEKAHNNFHECDLFSGAELDRRDRGNAPLDRLIVDSVKVILEEGSENSWKASIENQIYQIQMPSTLAQTIIRVRDQYQEEFSKISSLTEVKAKLINYGYQPI